MITNYLEAVLLKMPTVAALENFVVFNPLVRLGLKLGMVQRQIVRMFCGDILAGTTVAAPN